FFSSKRRHTRSKRDWSSDVCSSDLMGGAPRSPFQNGRCQNGRRVGGMGGAPRSPFQNGRCQNGRSVGGMGGAPRSPPSTINIGEIGRASCRERVESAGGYGGVEMAQ